MSNLPYRVWQIWHTDYGKFAIFVPIKRNFNLLLQESPSSKRSERWRGMEEETSGMDKIAI